jgi:hypothetical protein
VNKEYDGGKNTKTASVQVETHLQEIKQNSRKDQNFDLDHFLSQMRILQERISACSFLGKSKEIAQKNAQARAFSP